MVVHWEKQLFTLLTHSQSRSCRSWELKVRVAGLVHHFLLFVAQDSRGCVQSNNDILPRYRPQRPIHIFCNKIIQRPEGSLHGLKLQKTRGAQCRKENLHIVYCTLLSIQSYRSILLTQHPRNPGKYRTATLKAFIPTRESLLEKKKESFEFLGNSIQRVFGFFLLMICFYHDKTPLMSSRRCHPRVMDG